jgi:hypothetical protein
MWCELRFRVQGSEVQGSRGQRTEDKKSRRAEAEKRRR